MTAPPSDSRHRAILARLQAEPRRFTFDAAVRVLAFFRRQADPAETTRFTSAAGSAYAGAEVSDVAVKVEPGRTTVTTTVDMIGLTGPLGVLPRHYSDAVVGDRRSRAYSLSDFLDLLAQRMIAAFAAAGTKYRPHRAADSGALARDHQKSDPIADVLLSVTGYGTPGLAERLLAGAPALRHYAGFFSAHPRSADRLEALASDWLGRPVKVEQFAGAWLSMPPDQQTRMPTGHIPGQFCQLSVDASAGVRAWDQQARIVLRIGPLDLAYFERLLPHRPLLRELASLVRAFVGFEVAFAVNPVLARDAVPPLVLARPDDAGQAGAGPMLGWNTWLPTSPITPRRTDASEPLFEGDIVEGLA
ncbi:MAG: type VI secretion system baseplate subunit TssG [Reyranellaceae bacterium]